jgi:hypothetical protein
MRGFFEDL